MRRLPAGRQAMRYLPELVDEDPQKTAARYGAVEQTDEQGPDRPSGPFDMDRAISRRPAKRQADRPRDMDRSGVRPAAPGEDGGVNLYGGTVLDQDAGAFTDPADSFDLEEPFEREDPLDTEAPWPEDDGSFFSVPYGQNETGTVSRPVSLFRWASAAPVWGVPIQSGKRKNFQHTAGRSGTKGSRTHAGAVSGAASRHGHETAWGSRQAAARAAQAAVRAGAGAAARSDRDTGQGDTPSRPFRPIRQAAGKGVQAAQTVQTVAQAAQRARSAAAGAAAAAGAGFIKAAVLPAALVAAVVLLPVLLVLVMFLAIFTIKTPPASLNGAYLYITRLDAQMEQDIRAAGADAVYFVNGQETDPGDIRIQTDVDWLLLYLDAAYGGAELSTTVSGTFGGGTIQEEIDAIHSRLYDYTVQTAAIPTETPGPDETPEPDAGPAPAETRQEVYVTVRSVCALLDGAVDEGTLELMRATAQVGPYAAMETLASPFEGGFYVEERWGWYDTGGGLQCRIGAVLIPLGGGSAVYSSGSGTVEAAGSGSVTMALDGGGRVAYSRLASLSVSPGQRLETGSQIGTISAGMGLLLEYQVDGETVNPLFYLPHTAVSGDIVAVAVSQLGNVGGEPYWSWYGFDAHVDWCACFVSWCADQCGMLQAGAIPKFAGCTTGSRWFREQGLWQDRACTPEPGQLIFFNWDGDEWVDHVGIVERVENGRVYTIEGNSGDRCQRSSYPLGDARIYGYGIPKK